MGDRITVTAPRETTGRTEVPLGSLNGGLWCDLPPQDIPAQGWTDGYDFVVDELHRVKTRRGRFLLSNLTEDANLTANFPSDERIYGMHQHRSSKTTDSFLAVIGDQIARYNGSVWAWLGGGSPITFDGVGIPTFTQIGDGTDEYTFVCVHGTKPLAVKQDGTYQWLSTSGGTGMVIDVEPRWCANYINRVWFTGHDSYGTWLYCSEPGGPLGWDSGSGAAGCQAFDIGWTDGDRIVGIAVKFGLLFIFKEHSIWYLNAYAADDPGDWEIKCFNPAIGGTGGCGYTVQDIGTDILYMSSDGDFRTLKDTDKTGLFDTASLSSKQLKSFLSHYTFIDACSILDRSRGWYLLVAQDVGDSTHSMFVIYDYAKKTGGEAGQGNPGLWYRVADMQEWNAVDAFEQVNARSCFVETNMFGTQYEVLSGGYEGCLFREWGQIDEAKETAEASPVNVKIRGWLVGKHIILDDYIEFDLYSISALVEFGSNPTGSYVQLGAVLDPDEANETRVNVVTYDDTFGVPFIWNETNWDEGYWDATANCLADSAIDGRARTFAVYASSYGSDVTLYKMFAALRSGRI